jgi:hypothetical protein
MAKPVHALVPGDIIVNNGFQHIFVSITKNKTGPGLTIHTTTGAVLIVSDHSTIVDTA